MLTNVRLTRSVGYAAKLSPSILSKVVCGLPLKKYPNLHVGEEFAHGSISNPSTGSGLSLMVSLPNHNKNFCLSHICIKKKLPEKVINLLFDQQILRELLISVSPNKVKLLLKQLKDKSIKQATVIGG
jgi:selenophosphate synthase